MATSKDDIRGWIDRGIKEKATHLIVVVDTFDYCDYPVYVKFGEDSRDVATEINKQSMQRVMEVYNLSMDIESQLNEYRSFNF